MINCNPETVSTDYDTSDRLYFEPLTAEDVLEILHVEQSNGELVGVIVQFGGQTPLKLAQALEDAGIPILGTSPDAIDLAEDRERFAALVDEARPEAARQRHRPQPRRGDRGRRADRLSGADAPELCARRPRDGDRRRSGAARRLYPDGGAGLRRLAGADRPVSARRDRGGCRRDLRRRRCRGRGRAPAYRGSRRPFGRQRLLDAALQPARRDHRRDRAPDRRRWPARSRSWA